MGLRSAWWLSRSFAQRGISDRKWVAESGDAACLRDWVSVVEQGSAVQGLVGDVEIFEGTDEWASQRRCLGLGHEVTSDAGTGFAAGRGGDINEGGDGVKGRPRAGSKFTL